jgi:nucleoid DNA-binding protein
MALHKRHIYEEAAKKYHVQVVQSKRIIQFFLDEVIRELAEKGVVELRNFGVFKVVKRKARRARNMRTGEEMMMSERKRVVFKNGKLMIKAIENPGAAEMENATEEGIEDVLGDHYNPSNPNHNFPF